MTVSNLNPSLASRAKQLVSTSGVLIGIVALFIFFSLASPFFFDPNNFLIIGRQTVLLMVAAFAMTFLILLGDIDLSIGAVTSLIGILVAMSLRDGVPLPIAILIALTSGGLIGLMNGLISVKGRVHSFIVTLGMASIARGVAITVTNNIAISVTNPTFLRLFAQAEPLGISIAVWYVAVLFILLHTLLTRSRFGREIYAVGGNAKAARLSGIPADVIKLRAFTLAGVVVGIGALLQTARIGTGFVEGARNLELDAIAAVVLGGTSFTGGRGALWRTVLGALLIGILNNGLTLLNVLSYYQLIIKGGIVILAVLLDRWTH
ncbi:MAG: ABC transporter permease [Deinococcota bacterium]